MTEHVIAVLAAVALSVLIAIIEIPSRAKTDLASCIHAPSFIYLSILIVGNVSTTLAASSAFEAAARTGATLAGPAWFWYALIGVFGFEAVLKNLNVTFFNNGVLSIHDWVSRARDKAEATAIEAYANVSVGHEKRLAQKLALLPEGELNAHILQLLGKEKLEELHANAHNLGVNVSLYKALALAHANLKQAEAIVNSHA